MHFADVQQKTSAMDTFEFLIIFLSLSFKLGETSHYIPVIDENYVDCGHSGYINFEGLELHALNDTVSFTLIS